MLNLCNGLDDCRNPAIAILLLLSPLPYLPRIPEDVLLVIDRLALTKVEVMLLWAIISAMNKHRAETNMLVAQIRGSALLFIFLNLLAASAPATTPKIPVPMVMPPNIRLLTKHRGQLSTVKSYSGKRLVLGVPLLASSYTFIFREIFSGQLGFYFT